MGELLESIRSAVKSLAGADMTQLPAETIAELLAAMEQVDAGQAALEGGGPRTAARGVEGKRIKELERELRRKDKALAEAAALLVLQKKVREIWGDGDDDTDEGNGK